MDREFQWDEWAALAVTTAARHPRLSNHTFHPSLVLAKAIDLTTTFLLGWQTQPEQDWLPMSIPQTYLIAASSSEDADEIVLITHLLLLG
ncbi:hypothetical protein KSF_001170 [Reticulibacter mediterranei]|uniref:Uncharacterized protein n=1 Tax=Reticulibacter mediterranei TaxID=2778369 RepID=A0A8J3MWP6_9CHLR|nr:hypothetical protein [Reticulibacter mediterranei]GHO90069.1 hypothetical protein KSF_001170 [Reticulibacter mediterranei]